MAKAKLSDMMPKLVFRENGAARTEGSHGLKEKNVESNWINVNKTQSFKTVFLGDSSVGKTCLAKLYVNREVESSTTNTIGFDHHVKELELEDDVTVKLQLWDTAGMEQFRSALITKYYRNADGIVLVFDITRRETFEHLDSWISEVKQYCAGGLDRLTVTLIGNKVDKQESRAVSIEEAQSYARRHKMMEYVEISAKYDSHLEELDAVFVRLSQEMLRVRESMEMTRSATMKADKGSVIVLSDEWEVITAPEAPVPTYAYRAHEAARSRTPKKCSMC